MPAQLIVWRNCMLHEFLTSNREELISRCQETAAARRAPLATGKNLECGLPIFLTQLTRVLREETPGPKAAMQPGGLRENSGNHGNELLLQGFTVDQIVHGYGDLCQAVTGLAIERNASITNHEFRIFNRCLDDAIADAVSEFTHERDQVIADDNERMMKQRLGFLAHEFRNLTNTTMLALEVFKRSGGEIAGATGAILDRSLNGMRDLCARVFVEVCQKPVIRDRRERVLVSEFVGEAQSSATAEAKVRGVELVVSDVEHGLTVNIDRQILSGALANLLQNAFKFTRPQSRVLLKTLSSGDRVLIEVEDECGGLPKGNAEDLFLLFEQKSSDRSGVGLGLAISRRGVEANGGKLHVRTLPDKGCVFTIDLPRLDLPEPH
jgi:signal transduction histidine kinase